MFGPGFQGIVLGNIVEKGFAAEDFVPSNMKEKIIAILTEAWKLQVPVELTVPEIDQFGHFSTNVAMRLAKERGVAPLDLARELAAVAERASPAGMFQKIEPAAPGFVNLWLADGTVQKEFAAAAADGQFGFNNSITGKTVMVEYTDPNPFKLFHIGHLMSNTIGESLARLAEAAHATVRRANYYGDVGLHIAKSLWGMRQLAAEMPADAAEPGAKMAFLGKAYAFGSKAYDEQPAAKDEIVAINKKVYERSDADLNALYDKGLAWSLAYFETVYQRLGTKFDDYLPESSVGDEGVKLVRSRPDIFKESDGAVVFPGEAYGLHTRVFINSQGLPTYEAKELGLNKKKFELYPLDRSLIVTGNEVKDYFNVLLKAMELVLPDVAAKTVHKPHGMLRLPGGKMSSRTGDVITAEALLDQIKEELAKRVSERSTLDGDERALATERLAVASVKYSILKQHPGQDIVFDFEKSLSFEGDSGPYLQYAYARLRNIIRKADEQLGAETVRAALRAFDASRLGDPVELALMRRIIEFPDVVMTAQERFAPSGIATYLFRLAVTANKFYETVPVLKDEDERRRGARLALADMAARTIARALGLLGIATLEKI